jgi:hypothetical protein
MRRASSSPRSARASSVLLASIVGITASCSGNSLSLTGSGGGNGRAGQGSGGRGGGGAAGQTGATGGSTLGTGGSTPGTGGSTPGTGGAGGLPGTAGRGGAGGGAGNGGPGGAAGMQGLGGDAGPGGGAGSTSSIGGSAGGGAGGGAGAGGIGGASTGGLGGGGGQAATIDGPGTQGPEFPHLSGDPVSGKQVFRFETFGNEGFWTDAVQLPQGIVAAALTPKQALGVGLSVNVDSLDATTRAAVAAEIAASGTNGPLLNAAATTIALINANAVIGVVVRDTNGDGVLDVAAGDKVGVTCAACHAVTDHSVLDVPGGGSIGREIDGPTSHNLNVGRVFAVAANTRALYPVLQLRLLANGNRSIGRAPDSAAITFASTEADVDAYLSNPVYYPVGTFDDAPDGNGAPQHIAPFFRTDLSAPYGSPGDIARLDNFNNLVYTTLLDLTVLTTPEGRNFLEALGGAAAGAEIADNYLQILTATGVKGPGASVPGTGFPFVTATLPSGVTAGSEEAPTGRRVNEQKLRDLNAYTDGLHPPVTAGIDAAAVSRGRDGFRSAGCISCHNVSQARRVPSFVVPEAMLFPSYAPVVLAQRPVEVPFRPTAFAPIQDDPSTIFDDKVVVVEASRRGEVRGGAMPLLMDLARKPSFLHDSSVPSLDALLSLVRGPNVPHPFYVDMAPRADVVEFLRSLDDTH